MNNEPVAWMLADKEKEYIRSIMAVQHDFVPQGCVEIPLYTHPVKEVICLTKAEIESGLTRVQWAEALIKQLPEEHEGRNSWLLNYGDEK